MSHPISDLISTTHCPRAFALTISFARNALPATLYGSHLLILTTQLLSLPKVGPSLLVTFRWTICLISPKAICPLPPTSVVLSQTRLCHSSPSMALSPLVAPYCHLPDIHNPDIADFSHFISWDSFRYKVLPELQNS